MAGRIAFECLVAGGRVIVAGVVKERLAAVGRVATTTDVIQERLVAIGCIPATYILTTCSVHSWKVEISKINFEKLDPVYQTRCV